MSAPPPHSFPRRGSGGWGVCIQNHGRQDRIDGEWGQSALTRDSKQRTSAWSNCKGKTKTNPFLTRGKATAKTSAPGRRTRVAQNVLDCAVVVIDEMTMWGHDLWETSSDNWSENRMRSGPATRTASDVDSCSCLLSPHGGGMTASARQRSRSQGAGSAAFAKASCASQVTRPRRTTAAVASGPACSLKQARGGGRNARATSSRSRTVLGCPSATHFCESPAAASSSAIIRPVQECSRFAEPTLRQVVAARKAKSLPGCEETVEDETSLWRREEN
jgi:hypothetical protein